MIPSAYEENNQQIGPYLREGGFTPVKFQGISKLQQILFSFFFFIYYRKANILTEAVEAEEIFTAMAFVLEN